MEDACHPERACDADTCRHRIEPGLAVEINVLTRIKNVEACRPDEHEERKQDRDFVKKAAANRDPRSRRRDRECRSENEMGKGRKAFCVAVTQDKKQSYGR